VAGENCELGYDEIFCANTKIACNNFRLKRKPQARISTSLFWGCEPVHVKENKTLQ
jgi:hypothetical protein